MAAAASASAMQRHASEAIEATSTSTTPPPPTVQGSVVHGLDASSTPAIVPEDPFGALQPFDAAATILRQPALVMTRQIEMMNVLVGFEQANKYAMVDANGTPVGWVVEEDTSMVKAVGRQMMRTHRPFKAQVLDLEGKVLLKISRPFAFINSRIMIWTPDDRLIGEVQQEWHIYRRRYNLFTVDQPDPEEGRPDKIVGLGPGDENPVAIARARGDAPTLDRVQFAHIDGGFLALDFDMQDERGRVMGSVNRNFVGFARELFTDSGQYILRFDAAAMQELQQLQPGLGATAIAAPPSTPASSSTSTSSTTTTTTPDASQITGLSDPKEAALQIQANKDEVALTQLERRGGLTLDQRAVMLACAVSVDFDYFSRHSGSGGIMPMPIMMPMGGGAPPPPVPSSAEGENPVGTAIGGAAGGAAAGGGAADIPFGAGQAGMPTPSPPPAAPPTDVWGNPVSTTNDWGEDVWAEDPVSTEDSSSSWFGNDDDGDGGDGDGGGFSWGDILGSD
ncbi:hypothetical protein DFQ26_002370 [Actinomortierella ambigua]|nr:hypothetical protein DFQ26_002370 [Actinomortierella ambigua]